MNKSSDVIAPWSNVNKIIALRKPRKWNKAASFHAGQIQTCYQEAHNIKTKKTAMTSLQ